MKSLLLSLSLAFAAVLMQAADGGSLNGNWQVHLSIAGNERDHTCTFTQKSNDLTGSCSSDNGPVNINGKVDGNKVTWKYKSEYQGSPITVTYQGTRDSANKITGSVSVEEFGAEGEFTATQSK